jgi:2-methylcitrate dehydratase PrpD
VNVINENIFIEKLVENIIDTHIENFDNDTLERARNRIIDTVGCLIGGANASGNSEIIKLVRGWGGREEATILIHGGKIPAQNAAMVNSIMARSFDFEPVSPYAEGASVPGHISGTTVMTALAMGEAMGISGKDLITALIVSDDITSRVLLAGAGAGLSKGWDHIGPINPFGATTIAGRLLGLNRSQMKNAFGIVLNQLGGSFHIIQDATTSFKLTQGLAAMSGILSAQLAEAGWSGPSDALFGEFGYYRLYTDGCHNPDILTKDLGKKYFGDGAIKPYSCCRATHGAIDCALEILNKFNIEVDDIREVAIHVSSGYSGNILARPFKVGDFPQADATFSFQYTVATALMRKSVRPEHFMEESIKEPQINDFINRIKVKPDLPADKIDSVRLKIFMDDGRELSESSNFARGDQYNNPMSKEEIISKFWINVEFSRALTREKAEKLLRLLEKMEDLDNVKKLVRLLV